MIVKSGSFTVYDAPEADDDDADDHDADDHDADDHDADDHDADDQTCTGTTYSVGPGDPVGKVFVDAGYGHVHIGRNEGSTNTELYVTYLDVPVGAAPRIDAPNPGSCGF